MPEITVRAMTDAEFAGWQEALARAYADDQVRAGNWAPDEALDRAREDSAARLPRGRDTPGMLFLVALGPGGEPVGRLWLGLEHPRGTADCAFLYDIEVDEPHRGQGYGRALLTAAEEAARSRGASAARPGQDARAARSRAIALGPTPWRAASSARSSGRSDSVR